MTKREKFEPRLISKDYSVNLLDPSRAGDALADAMKDVPPGWRAHHVSVVSGMISPEANGMGTTSVQIHILREEFFHDFSLPTQDHQRKEKA